MKKYAKVAESVDQYVQEVRQWLHQHPELGFREEKTISYLIDKVNEMNCNQFTIRNEFLKGGLVIDYIVSKNDLMSLFRADIDALPITEATGLPYASVHKGVMHACGHDTHTAMLLGFMKLVADKKVVPNRNIRFVFQRAEEVGGQNSGGKILVNLGVLNGVDEVHALHIWPQSESGSFVGSSGTILANGDMVTVTITGPGGHAAFGSKIANPIVASAELILKMKKVVEKYEGCEIHPVMINAGEVENIIPHKMEIIFSARNFLNPVEREEFHNDLKQAGKMGKKDIGVEVKIRKGYPALNYDEETFNEDKKTLIEGGINVERFEPMLGGEDFAYYTQMQGGAKGGMWMLGSYQEGSGEHHTPTFNPNPNSFKKGVEFWCLMATK